MGSQSFYWRWKAGSADNALLGSWVEHLVKIFAIILSKICRKWKMTSSRPIYFTDWLANWVPSDDHQHHIALLLQGKHGRGNEKINKVILVLILFVLPTNTAKSSMLIVAKRIRPITAPNFNRSFSPAFKSKFSSDALLSDAFPHLMA